MSLSNCLKKAGKSLSQADIDYIKGQYDSLVGKGVDKRTASIESIDNLLKIVDKDIMNVSKKGKAKKGKKLGYPFRSPFKSREFLIPDELVEDFLERDIEELAHLYLRNTIPDLELIKRFGDKKTPPEEILKFENIKSDIAKEYEALMDSAKTAKERIKLRNEKDNVIKAFLGMVERVRGVYDVPDGRPSLGRRINTAARNLNYLRLMGGVAVSSIPDMARTIMSEGFMRAFGDGFIPLVRNIKKLKVSPSVKDEMRYYGMVMDTITSGRIEALSDINNYAMGNTKFERSLEYLSGKFGNISLMNQWNDMMKTVHGLAMQARVYDDLSKGKFDERLSKLGLTKDEAQDIFEQVKKHGSVEGGARLFNPQKWDRQDLAFAWASALRKESDRVIIMPGQEKPLFMSRDMGKTILQFRSFMMSSTQRTLLAAAQGQDANALGGMATMITFGAMTYALKQLNSGREVSDDPRVWIAEGIDRSGALGIIMEASNTAERVSGNRFGLRGLMGIAEPASRFASRNEIEAVMGPTYGSLLSTTLSIARAGLDEHEWKERDTSNIRRMLPFQNLFYLRRAINAVEKQAHETLAE